eukprot:Nitzschia sp. Nitz4//scaffold196_size54656//39781//42046//NITZ4_006645-RA/size54656-augustus-gene-0.43-mRNA-1//-1//CDS//3329540444//9227//frame0
MGSSNTSKENGAPYEPYQVRVSLRFVVGTLVTCALLAFAVGRTTRVLLLPPLESASTKVVAVATKAPLDLPNPVLKNGRLPPPSIYTSKNFDTAKSTVHSRWVVTEEGSCPTPLPVPEPENEEEDDEVHLPVGQHLLMDIRNIDASFLASEERLAKAMLEVVGQCGLTLLSYHCHGLEPAGVSCVGVLLESHVSFHTWPVEGVITLDLFTCGPNSLLPIVDEVERLFSIPRVGGGEPPKSVWAYKWRGYGAEDPETKAELTDLFTFPIGAMTDYKKEIISTRVGKDRVDIYDVLRPGFQSLSSYERSLEGGLSYEATHKGNFAPDRIVFVNGVLQSRTSGEASFYELLVHPPMFAHPNPRTIAIVGFGDGAILREVLKHNTVEKVIMVDFDDGFVNLTRQHFPNYYNCDFLEVKDCLADPRVQIYYDNLTTLFGEQANVVFDVIIMDDLDIVKDMADTAEILQGTQRVMSENAVMVATTGESPTLNTHRNDVAGPFIDALEQAGFQSIRDYEEGHIGFGGSAWRYTIAFKSLQQREAWFHNEAELNLEIRRRAMKTKDGKSPFRVFDSAIQHTIMYPTISSALVHCRRIGGEECLDEKDVSSEYPICLDASTTKFAIEMSSMSNAKSSVSSLVTSQEFKVDCNGALETCLPSTNANRHCTQTQKAYHPMAERRHPSTQS